MTYQNLNTLLVPHSGPNEAQIDNGITSSATCQVIFKNHKEKLIEEIEKYPYVAGCVAWLTDRDVLAALSRCKGVGIVVQKEDFLRPDKNGKKNTLRRLYENITCLDQYNKWTRHISFCIHHGKHAIRCAGNHNSNKSPSFPRMHNKFIVFGNEFGIPQKVWTGSYNLSFNATQSWENVVLIESNEIADAYMKEYAQIYVFSEPLDWESDWCAPEFRIGS